jgi:predicted RNase H-like HicB family nuclease
MAAMTSTKPYVAVYERDSESDAWLVHIKTIPGCLTYGRTLRQAEARIREALAAWLDHDPDGLEIASEWPAELEDVATKVSQARRDAAASAQAAGAATARAAQKLERMGLSRRDTAEVLGISHQRVQQLLAS